LKYWLFILSVLLLTGSGVYAAGTTYLNSNTGEYSLGITADILEDKTAALSLDDIRNEKFAGEWQASIHHIPNYGFSDSAFWLRFKIHNQSRLKLWLFEATFVLHDYLELYCPDPQHADHFVKKISGDMYRYATRDVKTRTLVFQCDIPLQATTTLYLRGKSEGSHQYGFHAWNPVTFMEKKQHETLWYGAFFGIATVLIIYNLLLYKSIRNGNHIFYIMYVISYCLLELSLTGFGTQYLWSEYPLFNSRILPASIFITTAVFVTFTQKFLYFKEHAPLLDKVTTASVLVTLSCLVVEFFISYSLAVQVGIYNMIYNVLFVFAACFIIGRRERRAVSLYLLAFSAFLLGVGLVTTRNVGLVKAYAFADYGPMIGLTLQAIILSHALGQRIRHEQQKYQQTIENLNINLENQVNERTRLISDIINNVKSGFFSVDRTMRIKEGFTASCRRIFGKDITPGETITETLELTAREKEHVEAALEQIFDDNLPEEALLATLPRRYHIGDKTIDVEGAPVRDELGRLQNMLFTINDATTLSKMEQIAEQNQLLVHILRFKNSFRLFVADTKAELQQIHTRLDKISSTQIKAILHTIKGNAASFGLVELAAYIHRLEEVQRLTREHIQRIEEMLQSFLTLHAGILDIDYQNVEDEIFEVKASEIGRLECALRISDEAPGLRDAVQSWIRSVTSQPVSALLGPIDKVVHRLAEQYRKQVTIQVEGGDKVTGDETVAEVIRLLPHLIRNAIVHGIEEKGLRGRKDPSGLIKITFKEDEVQNSFWITVADDGAGINLNAIRSKAVKMGLVAEERATQLTTGELIDFIFKEGLSSRDDIDEVSGRGIGLTAIKNCVAEAGGQIEVYSAQGRGTTFVIKLPGARKNYPNELKVKPLQKLAS
jgi:signal transduction histidine kinase